MLTVDSELLSELKPWLQEGTRKFQPFTDKSYADLQRATRHTEIGLKFPEGQDEIVETRKHLALGLSQVLDLDAVQTYVLLHKYESFSTTTSGVGGKGTDDAEVVFKVCEFYFQERQALLECVLEVLRNELRDEPDVKSLQIKDVVGKFDAQVVERALSSLSASVSNFPSHHFTPSYAEKVETEGCLGRCPNRTTECGLLKYWTEQQTLEQLLLVQQVFLFYYSEDNTPSKDALTKLVRFTCEMRPDSLSGSLSSVATKNVVSTMNTLVFVFIEMLDVDGLLENLAAHESEELPDLSKWAQLDLTCSEMERISQPHFTLVWSVFHQLKLVLNPQQAAKLEFSPEQVASASISQGALERILFALGDECVRSSIDSTAFHSVLKNFCAAILVAFDLNPKRLPHSVLDGLTRILASVLKGEPGLVEQFWDEEYMLDQPIRNFLGECQQLFPTIPVPYTRLLQALCEAMDETNASLVNGQVLSHLRDLKSISVFHSPSDLMDAASEMHMKHQVPERMHLQIGKKVRLVKSCLYQIPECPGLFIDDKVIGSVLEHYRDGSDSSESKYLVSWTVDIDGYFLILCRLHSFSTLDDVVAKAEEIQLSFKLLSAVLTNSMSHWEELMAVKIDNNEIRLLDVAALIFDRFKTILGHAKEEEVDKCLSVLTACLHLAVAVSTCDPNLIGSWLRTAVGGAGVASGLSSSDPSQCLPSIAGIYRSELSKGSFDFTVTFLRLANSLVEKAVFGPESILYLYFGTFGVLSNIQTMTVVVPHHRLDLASAALSLFQNTLRIYELLHDMQKVGQNSPLSGFDWGNGATSFQRDVESFLANKFSISTVMRSSLIFVESSSTERMHVKGQSVLASKMEMSIRIAGKVLLRLLSLAEMDSLSDVFSSCVIPNLVQNGFERSLAYIVTSYCEYQFDLSVRQVAFEALTGLVGVARQTDNFGLVQGCYPYSLTSAESSKFLRSLAASLAEESLLNTPRLFSSAIQFLTLLVHSKSPFPPVVIPGYDSRSEERLLSLWIHNLSACLVSTECRTREPVAFSCLMEFLDGAWKSGLSFITQGILENTASWNTILELASTTQQWNSLGAAWTFKFADFGQDYFCRIHAFALSILSHEFFLTSRGFGIDPERASSIEIWMQQNFSQVMLEAASIKMDVSTRLRLQVNLKMLLVEASSISSLFIHMGMRSILKHVEARLPGDSTILDALSDVPNMQIEELNKVLQFAHPVEHLFLCCMDSQKLAHSTWLRNYSGLEQDKFAVDFSILSQDYMAMQKVQAIQNLLKKLNAQAQVEAAATSLSKVVSSIALIMKEQKGGDYIQGADMAKLSKTTSENLAWSLKQLTNHNASQGLFVPFSPMEDLMLDFGKSLVQTCTAMLTIGLNNDLLVDGWAEDVFYHKDAEWMHDWLTFLLSDFQKRKDCGAKMSVQLLLLLNLLYSNADEPSGMLSIGMETVLKSFALSCSFCHSSKDLKLSSLLVIKCIIDDWLSPKMSHGDWLPLLEESPAKSEICKLGDKAYPSELRSMLLVTAASIAATGPGAGTLINWWKEFGTFRPLIKYVSFLVSEGSSGRAELCSWLELVSTLLHVCSDLMTSTDGIEALRVFASALTDELHPFITNLLSSFSNHDRKLQLGDLTLVKHVAFLLYALSKFAGRWHLTLPQSIVGVQDSVVMFLVYAAQPSLKPYFSVECKVLDQKEVSLCRGTDHLALEEGWFGAVRPLVTESGNDRKESAGGVPKLTLTKIAEEKKTSQYSFQVGLTMYTNICYLLEFLLISLPTFEDTMQNTDAFHDSLIVSLIGVQIQSIRISAGLCNAAGSLEGQGDLYKMFGRILNLSTYVQEVLFKSNFGLDKHGRNSWRLMSNLTAAYSMLKRSMEGLLATMDTANVDANTKSAVSKIQVILRGVGERWAGGLLSDPLLSNLYP